MTMKFLLVILFTFVLSNCAFGQLQPYMLSAQIDSLLRVDTTGWKHQTAAVNYSMIGAYMQSLQARDREFPNARGAEPTHEQHMQFSQFTPVDARKAILEEATKTRVLILNEAHHNSLHRIFLADLLPDLHKLGYTFIGMEALSAADTQLHRRKYPVIQSGYYTKEPCFGNLIREALDIGYTVFPYEQDVADSAQVKAGREKAQALNIATIINRHPKAKVLLYCGYDHAAEDTLRNFMGLPMAGQLKLLTGIDPFTIDQTALTEYVVVGNRYRKLIQERHDAVFVDSQRQYFNKATLPKRMDCNLYHPNTEYEYGRPTWLKRKNTTFVLLQDKVKIDYPCLIKIYLATDDKSTAVPIDVVEVKSANEKVASVILKRRKHVAVVVNGKGEQQEFPVR